MGMAGSIECCCQAAFLPAATKLWPRLCFYSCVDSVHRGGFQQGDPSERENPLAGRTSAGRTPLAGRTPWQGDPPGKETPGRENSPLAGRPPLWQLGPPGKETPWQGDPLAGRTNPPPPQGQPPWQGETPLARMPPGKETPLLGRSPQHTVNERPVCILLECILVPYISTKLQPYSVFL